MPEPTPVNDGTVDDGTQPTGDDAAAALKQENETLKLELEEGKKRLAGQTRSWQEEKAAREAAEAKAVKYDKYNFLLEDDDGEAEPTRQTTSAPNPSDQTAEQLSQVRLELIETKYIANPENREKAHIVADSKLKQMVIQEGTAIALRERQEYGNQVSSDEEIFAKGVDEVAKFVDTLKADGAAVANEDRQNIPRNVNLGRRGQSPPKPGSDDGEEEPIFIENTTESIKESFDGYVGDKQSAQNKMRFGDKG